MSLTSAGAFPGVELAVHRNCAMAETGLKSSTVVAYRFCWCRRAESEARMYKDFSAKLQRHLDDLRHHAVQPATRAVGADAISSEQRLQRIEEAVTRSETPRSDTLLQLLHSSSEGQAAARSAADAAETELKGIRQALHKAEGQVEAATQRAERLAQQLSDEQCTSRELREQSRCALCVEQVFATVAVHQSKSSPSFTSASKYLRSRTRL